MEKSLVAMPSRATWIYVTGSGRSGTTLLGTLAADAAGAFNCGEMRQLWRRVYDRQPCECGAPLDACDVWAEVAARVRASMGDRFDDAVASASRYTRSRLKAVTRRFPHPTELECTLRAETERAVELATGASVFVDTSKAPSALVAAARRERPLRVVHLVRDPRGVAYSHLHPKSLPTVGLSLPGIPVRRTSRRWSLDNGAFEFLTRRVGRSPWVTSTRLTYEDLADDPGRALAPVVDGLGGRAPGGPAAAGHGVAGNTVLYDRRPVALDRRWHTEMSARDQAVTVALTAPLLVHYGYPLRPPA